MLPFLARWEGIEMALLLAPGPNGYPIAKGRARVLPITAKRRTARRVVL